MLANSLKLKARLSSGVITLALSLGDIRNGQFTELRLLRVSRKLNLRDPGEASK